MSVWKPVGRVYRREPDPYGWAEIIGRIVTCLVLCGILSAIFGCSPLKGDMPQDGAKGAVDSGTLCSQQARPESGGNRLPDGLRHRIRGGDSLLLAP